MILFIGRLPESLGEVAPKMLQWERLCLQAISPAGCLISRSASIMVLAVGSISVGSKRSPSAASARLPSRGGRRHAFQVTDVAVFGDERPDLVEIIARRYVPHMRHEVQPAPAMDEAGLFGQVRQHAPRGLPRVLDRSPRLLEARPRSARQRLDPTASSRTRAARSATGA